MNPLSKKLRELEKNVLPEQPKKETSRWGFDNGDSELNKVEQQFYDTVQAIGRNTAAEDMTPDKVELILKANRFVTFRILDLFDMWAKGIICYNDPLMIHIFTLRFYWFLDEVSKQISQQYEEERIFDDPDFTDLCPGEQDKRLAPLYAKWRRDLFTKESFTRFCDEHMKPLPELTPEQEKEMEKLEQLDREAEERELRLLAEKCVSCSEKCKWYSEQIEESKKNE